MTTIVPEIEPGSDGREFADARTVADRIRSQPYNRWFRAHGGFVPAWATEERIVP